MSHRNFILICILTMGLVVSMFIVAAAQTKPYTAPKTPDGKPDLQGIWSTLTSVPLERPANLGAKEFYTPEDLPAQAQRAAGGGRGRGGGRGAAPETGDLAVHYDTRPKMERIAPWERTSRTPLTASGSSWEGRLRVLMVAGPKTHSRG